MVELPSIIQTIASTDRPLLFVDADEVLLRFVERLETFLLTEGYELSLTSFRLTGNVVNKNTGNAASDKQIQNLIASFFDACVDDIPPVENAATALKTLSETFQIYVVSNVPYHCKDRRAANLIEHGIPFPLIANSGNKGRLIAELDRSPKGFTAFVDDLPYQHTSVKKHAPHVKRFHFIADKRLQKLTPKADDAHFRIDCWNELTDTLQSLYESSNLQKRP